MSYPQNPIIARARRAPKLGRQEERELIEAYQLRGDKKAGEALAASSLRYVVAVAFRFSRYGVPLDALIAEGNMGLVRAMDKYDLAHEVRFSTYCTYWIRSFVIDHILRSWSLVGGGAGALKTRTFFRLRREASRAFSLCGESEQAMEVLAERMQLPKERVQSLVRQVEQKDVSLNAPARHDGTTTLMDGLSSYWDYEEELQRAQTLEQLTPTLKSAVAKLNERERYIVENRLSADAEEALPLSAIAERFGVSRERVRQIETRAKEKLRMALSMAHGASGMLAA